MRKRSSIDDRPQERKTNFAENAFYVLMRMNRFKKNMFFDNPLRTPIEGAVTKLKIISHVLCV